MSCALPEHYADSQDTYGGPLLLDPRLHHGGDGACVEPLSAGADGARAAENGQSRVQRQSAAERPARRHYSHEYRDGPWLRQLSAWAEGEWPPGSIGRSAALRVLRQVRRLVRQQMEVDRG